MPEFLYELSAFVETLVQLEHWWFSKSSCVTSNRISCQISACEHGILNLNGEAACTLSIGSTRLKGGAQIVHIQQQQQQQNKAPRRKQQTKIRNDKQQTTTWNFNKFHLFCTYDSAKLAQLIRILSMLWHVTSKDTNQYLTHFISNAVSSVRGVSKVWDTRNIWS